MEVVPNGSYLGKEQWAKIDSYFDYPVVCPVEFQIEEVSPASGVVLRPASVSSSNL